MAANRQIAFNFDFTEPPVDQEATPMPPAAEAGAETTPVPAAEITPTPEEEAAPLTETEVRMQADIEAAIEPPLPAAVSANGQKGLRGRRSIRELEILAGLVEVPPDEELFSKQYYAMNEVAAMFRVNHSLLRYWESEFDILKPRKNRKGDRHFRPEDIKNLQVIHYLLRQQKYTIEGARDYLKHRKKTDQKFAAIQALEKLKLFLLELKAGM